MNMSLIPAKYLLLCLTEAGIDPLELTRLWLGRSFDKLNNCPGAMATPAAVMNCAYMELLEWDINRLYPEV